MMNFQKMMQQAQQMQFKMQEMQEKTKGARTIPQIFIGEIYVGGYNELKALEVAGKLDSLLKI